MAKSKAAQLWAHFDTMEDPRDQGRNFQHSLQNIIVMTIVAYAAGMKSLEACAHFARMQEKWFGQYLSLPNGVPSHDVFRKVMGSIDVEAFQRGFVNWTRGLQDETEGDVVAIDGKTVRRSGTATQKAVHLVSAWSKLNGIVLGQISTDEKSNEITAIPKLIESLALEGCIVTIDAMGCQTDIAQAIVDKGAHYLLAVKDNQKALHDELKVHFDAPEQAPQFRTAETADKGHGRIEIRRVWVSDDVDTLVEAERWPCIASVIRVDSERTLKDQTTHETRYYISSLAKPSPEQALDVVRSHWEVENKLHWCLDVTMNEDGACLRDRQLAENGSTIRRLAMNSLRRHPGYNGNLAKASRSVAFDPDFREILISSIISNA